MNAAVRFSALSLFFLLVFGCAGHYADDEKQKQQLYNAATAESDQLLECIYNKSVAYSSYQESPNDIALMVESECETHFQRMNEAYYLYILSVANGNRQIAMDSRIKMSALTREQDRSFSISTIIRARNM